MIRLCLIMLVCGLLHAQTPVKPDAASAAEQESLRQAVQENSSSNVDLMRALEAHLAKYPNSTKKLDIERAIVKAAIEVKDEARIARYGERVLAVDTDDLLLMERVSQALLNTNDQESAKRAMRYATHYEELVRQLATQPAPNGAEQVKRKDEVERAISRGLLIQAIATGKLGNNAGAADIARKSFETYPNAEAALELARRLSQMDKHDEAVRAYADAFTLQDSGLSETVRATVRARMGESYRKWKGAETGLGDIVLQAYDRTGALMAKRRASMRELDPNVGLTNPMEFTLTGLGGEKLPMASLMGKVVVLDFWATWCGPCRAQHPLYEQVKKRFAGRNDVVFLSVDTDEDRGVVPAYLKEQGWGQKVYFEDGLSRVLKVTSIPTTVIYGKNGTLVSRMNGFDPSRFVDMLAERIQAGLN